MGRAHEVRAKAMAATAAKRSALFNRASKEIYMAAKSGEPDPSMNLALRSAIEKWRGQNVTKDVIDRAIQKAKGEAEAIREVQQAKAEGLKMLRDAGMDDKVLKLRSLEAFEVASNGQATKIIVPSDLQNLAGVVTSISEIAKK